MKEKDGLEDFEPEPIIGGLEETEPDDEQPIIDDEPPYDDMDDDGLGGFNDGGFMDESMSPMEKHSDLLKDLTNFDPYLKIKVSEWLGLRWSEEVEKYVKDADVQPTMNTTGARWAVNFLRTYTRGNNIITNTDRDAYVNFMDDVIDVVLLNIGTRAEEFGIKSNGDILSVSTELIHAADLVLIGTGGDKNYTDLLQATVHRTENVSLQPSQQQQYANYNPQLPPIPQKRPNMLDNAVSKMKGYI